MSPVTSDEEEMIMLKSTSHCGVTITIGAKEMPLTHSVKTLVVEVLHHLIMWKKISFKKKPSHDSQTQEQMFHIIPQESTHSGRPVTTGLDLVE
jgi:hypothetical protein